jgi:hypothetical protein
MICDVIYLGYNFTDLSEERIDNLQILYHEDGGNTFFQKFGLYTLNGVLFQCTVVITLTAEIN